MTTTNEPVIVGDVICECCQMPEVARRCACVNVQIGGVEGRSIRRRLVLCGGCYASVARQKRLGDVAVISFTTVHKPSELV